FVDLCALRQFTTRGRSLLGQVLEETKPVTDARQGCNGQTSGIGQHFTYEGSGLCLIENLLRCHNISPLSACMLFVCMVVINLIPTINRSMPEKSEFATVESTQKTGEQYGDSE